MTAAGGGLTIDVVVPTYNRLDRLPSVCDSLLADPALHALVVVVDGADDGSLAWLQARAATDPRVVPVWTENGGQGRARQLGAERSTADVVLFVDDDVSAGPGLVSGHLAHQQRSPGVVLGYMPIDLGRRGPSDVATVLYAQEYEKRCAVFEQHPESILQHLWAGNMSIPREVAVDLPMFAPTFAGLLHEDQSLGMRCIRRGLAATFDRSLASTHLHSRTVEQFYRDSARQAAGNLELARSYPDVFRADAVDLTFLDGLPSPVAAALSRATRTAGSRRRLRALLITLIALTGQVRAYPLQTALAKLLRRVGFLDGAATAAH